MSDPVRIMAGRLRRRCAPLATATLGPAATEPWHSLLFDGGRHRFSLCLERAGLNDAGLDTAVLALHDEIAATDFAVPGHILAEIRVTQVDRSDGQALVSFEALTIDDGGERQRRA